MGGRFGARPPPPPPLPLPPARHRFFNTNNLWLHLPKLKAALEAAGGALALPLIKNKKTVNPRDAATPAVYQLETAMGAAVALFPDAGAVVVPRSRFAPVKTTGDLLLVRSDAYAVAPDATLAPTKPPPAAVTLDGAYKLVDALDALILTRMDRPMTEISPVEHAVMWIGVYEMQHCPDVPWRVVLNECIELAKEFGGTDGFKYVNAVLNGLAPELRGPEVQADRAKHPAASSSE